MSCMYGTVRPLQDPCPIKTSSSIGLYNHTNSKRFIVLYDCVFHPLINGYDDDDDDDDDDDV